MASKKFKIIELTFLPVNSDELERCKGTDYWYLFGWSSVYARRLAKKYPNLDIENWRTDLDVERTVLKEFLGVKAVVFPYKKPFIKNVLTWEMIKLLKKYQKEYKVILHFYSLYNIYYNLFIPYILPKCYLVLSHHGGCPPDKNSIEDWFKRKIYFSSIKHFDAVTYISNRTKIFLDNISLNTKRYFLPVGADFNFFKPIDKTVARKSLGLDINKIYAIYVGNFYRIKSVDLILETYYQLKKEYEFSIIFIGGKNDKKNDLYEDVTKSGCPYYGYQPWDILKYFYAAADFYIHPAFHPDFGGFDTTLQEIMAMNRPVLSSQLSYLDFDHSELGITLDSESEIIVKTKLMINNFKKFKKVREIAIKELDGNTSIIDCYFLQ
jgi:glycosyltransferase involved in cell wall biosynthesis